MIRFIGDVHGRFEEYLRHTDVSYPTIQVGDFGAGFRELPELDPKDGFIRGNHDDPAICRAHPNWIPDGHTGPGGMFFVGGAFSIDRRRRTPGYDWWPDEELGLRQWEAVMEAYERAQPRIMVSHDAPRMAVERLFGIEDTSTTTLGLEALLNLSKPSLWVFGHHHRTVDETIDGVRFICLDELDHFDFEV